MANSAAPPSRSGFKIAVICAGPIEAECVRAVFDICWEDEGRNYGKTPGDKNRYTTGVIWGHNVVMVLFPHTASVLAVQASASLSSSYPKIELALVVGVCGVIPINPRTGVEIMLGDVIVSTVQDSLRKAPKEIQRFIDVLAMRRNRSKLQAELIRLVGSTQFQQDKPMAIYPGADQDHLYEASYLHQHQSSVKCEACHKAPNAICSIYCDDLGCEKEKRIARQRGSQRQGGPLIHLGCIGSTDTVIKSGIDRDLLATKKGLIAFEMEGEGVWDNFPTIVIKGACDYADNHKHKAWQPYAAMMAAGCLKVILSEWVMADELLYRDTPRSLGLCLTAAPLIRPDDFVGRAAEIDAIYNILRPDTPATQQRRVVLGGSGGIGKTQIAITYARRYKSSYTSVLWFVATSRSTLYDSLRSIASSLTTNSELEKLDDNQVLTQFRRWLSSLQNTHWLLIFDNYDDPDQLNLESFYADISHGSIIITTRLPDRVRSPHVRIRPLISIEDSLEILQIRSGRQDVRNDIGARRLAERMAGLPLALVTAATYLRDNTLSFEQYLDIYEERWQLDRYRPLQLPDYTHYTLYTAWDISYNRLQADIPEAAQTLQLLAYFDHQKVWYELMHAGLSDDSPQWLNTCFAEQVDFDSLMGTLVDHCLVEVQHTKQSYGMHACVHDWTLGKLNSDINPILYWYVFDCVAASISHETWESLGHVQHARLMPHAVRLTYRQFETAGKDIPATRLNEAEDIAELLQQQFRLDAAIVMRRRALAGKEKELGPVHPSTLRTVNNLGRLYADQGKLDLAGQMYFRALAGYEKVLGPEHTSTLNTVNNLGRLYADQGKLGEAEQMLVRALAGYEKVLGPDHTSTLDTVNNLGLLYHAQGKVDLAEQMLVRAWTGKEKQTPTIQALENLSQMSWKDSTYESALQATKFSFYHSLGKTDKAVMKDVNDIQTDSAIGPSLTRPGVGQDHEQALPIAKTEYAPSEVSDLHGPQDDAYMTDFAKDLYDTVKAYNPDSKALEQIFHVLPDLLKAFAQKIGNRAEDQAHKDISYFFQKNRDDIRNTFKRLFESENFRPGDFAMDKFLTTVDATTYEDIEITDTHGAIEIQHDTALSDGEENIDLHSDADCAAPLTVMYRNIITSSAAYEWLVTTLYRELNVTRARPDIMDHIGYSVLSYLPASGEVSRRAPVAQCKVLLEFDWDPLTFVAEQEYTESSHIALERAITLTGSADDAQAATTHDYLVQTWPATGNLVMQMIKEAACAQERCATSNLPDGTEVKVQFLAESISMVEIFGPRTSIAEIAQQFSWLSAALRSSPFEDGIAMCTPKVRDARKGLLGQTSSRSKSDPCTTLKIHFDIIKIASDTNLPGHCWHRMFRNPIIVGGYPILAKGSQGKGVEMPLSMIAKLARAEKANQFNGNVFLKGFSTMLLAVELNETVLIWHYLYNTRGERISYLDHIVQPTENIALHQLDVLRHVVGWCERAEYSAGAANANYDIDGTGLEPPHASCLLEKVSIGGGKFITASLTFALGVKDTPPHLTVNGYLNKLVSIATEYFILWDEADKRGWLVDGGSTLLHLVKTSLHHYSKEYDFAFIFDFDQMKYPDELKLSSAIRTLFDNCGLPIFPDNHGHSKEISKEQVGSSMSEKQILKKKMDYFLFGDLVEQHYKNLELIVDCHRYVAGKDGINIKMRARKYLEGWDFVELATDHKHLNPRVATLSALGYGWVDFVRSINAIPLFGRGFGDIIKPAISEDGMCPQWSTLPKYKYYLAASMYDMKRVTAKHGNKYADPPIPVHGLVWHCPEKALAPCKCQQYQGQPHHSITQKHHDPVQTFYPTKSKLLLRVRGPGQLYEDGAVVFGHNVSWGYQWQEDGKKDIEKDQKAQTIPIPELAQTLHPTMLDSHLPTLDPNLLMPQSSSQARNYPSCSDRTATSDFSSRRSRVYTIGSSSLQTSEQSALRIGSSVNSQTTTSTMSPPLTHATNCTPASSRPAGTLDSKERTHKSGPKSEQTLQTAQPAAAVASENATTSSSQTKSKARKYGWQRFWKKKTT